MSIVKYHESHYVAELDMYDNLWAHLRAEIYSLSIITLTVLGKQNVHIKRSVTSSNCKTQDSPIRTSPAIDRCTSFSSYVNSFSKES